MALARRFRNFTAYLQTNLNNLHNPRHTIRNHSTSHPQRAKVIPNNLKGKSKSSQEWLTRQLSDPYVEKAKMMNYRCRSAFKLLEIDDKYHILKPGGVVIDCGAAPGSWTQIATGRTNADGSNPRAHKGVVVSVDILQFHPVAGAITLGGMDFTLPAVQDKIRTILDGKKIDCVLSDMAPNATGVRVLDQENITRFCYSVLNFAVLMSAPGSNVLMKIWDNAETTKLEKEILRFYESVKRIKPRSSRKIERVLACDLTGSGCNNVQIPIITVKITVDRRVGFDSICATNMNSCFYRQSPFYSAVTTSIKINGVTQSSTTLRQGQSTARAKPAPTLKEP